MDRFPPEICSRIYSYACTDGGSTGISLSAVSHYVRETSRPFKFYSIALLGSRQTKSFAKFVKHNPGHVHGLMHLFVSNDGASEEDGAELTAPTVPRSELRVIGTLAKLVSRRISTTAVSLSSRLPGFERRRLVRMAWKDEKRDQSNIVDVLNILEAFHASLRSLSICFASESRTLPFRSQDLSLQFPHLPLLNDLTIRYKAPQDGGFDYSFFCSAVYRRPLHSLRRLDLSGLKLDSHSPYSMYNHISEIAPSLTHLCLPSRMACAIRDALESETSEDIQPPILPSTICRVCIAVDMHHGVGTNSVWGPPGEGCILCHLLTMAEVDERITLLDGCETTCGVKSRKTMLGDWLDRAEGQEGFWEGPQSVMQVIL